MRMRTESVGAWVCFHVSNIYRKIFAQNTFCKINDRLLIKRTVMDIDA